MAVAIALGHGHQLGLAGVSLLALDVAVGRLGKHGHIAGQQVVSGVDLVVRLARDDKERNALAHVGGPPGDIVESELRGGLAGVVPHQAIAFVGDHKRHADARSGRSVVVVRATHCMASPVEIALMVLAQAVVVLVFGRREGRAHLIERVVARPAVVQRLRSPVLVIRHRHLPVAHLEQRRALRGFNRDANRRRRSIEVLRDVRLSPGEGDLLLWGHRDGDARRAQHIAARARFDLPSAGQRLGGDAVARRRRRVLLQQTDTDAHDVLRVRLDHYRGRAARDNHLLRVYRRSHRQSKRQRACHTSRRLLHSFMPSIHSPTLICLRSAIASDEPPTRSSTLSFSTAKPLPSQ